MPLQNPSEISAAYYPPPTPPPRGDGILVLGLAFAAALAFIGFAARAESAVFGDIPSDAVIETNGYSAAISASNVAATAYATASAAATAASAAASSASDAAALATNAQNIATEAQTTANAAQFTAENANLTSLSAFNEIFNHKNDTDNPHQTTAEQVGAATPAYVDAATNALASALAPQPWQTNSIAGSYVFAGSYPRALTATAATTISGWDGLTSTPTYFTISGNQTITFDGVYFVAGAEYQTNLVNHFVAWRIGTNVLCNFITATPL